MISMEFIEYYLVLFKMIYGSIKLMILILTVRLEKWSVDAIHSDILIVVTSKPT